MNTLTSPGIQYYDHFLMKEIPAFKQAHASWNKEIVDLRKDVQRILKDLEKISLLKAGISVEEKAGIFFNILRDYLNDLSEFQNSLQIMIGSLSNSGPLASATTNGKLMDEEFRKNFRQAWHDKVLQMNLLLCELEPLKKESEVFIEAIFYIFDNYSKRSAMSRFNHTMLKPLSSVFQPIRKLVQSRLELSHF